MDAEGGAWSPSSSDDGRVRVRRIRKRNGRLCGSGAGFLSEAVFLAVFVSACSFSPLSAEEGLLVDYDFSRGSGTVLKDTSANRNDAKIVNARWVRAEKGYALEFNGKDTYVSLPLSVFNQDSGTWEMWVYADLEEQAGNTVRLFNSRHSREWESEFRTSGFLTWYFGNGPEASVGAEELADKAWNHVCFTWEYKPEQNVTLIKGYGNGVLGGKGQLHGKLAIPDRNRTGGTEQVGITIGEWKGAFFKGMIKDVKIWNRALDEMEILSPYLANAESFGTDLSRKRISVTSCALPIPGKVVVEADYRDVMIYTRALGDEGSALIRKGCSLLVELYVQGAERPILHQSVSPLPSSGRAEVSFDVAGLPAGKVEARATLLDSAGRPTQKTATDACDWPGRPSWLTGTPPLRVLNNLVVELLNVEEVSPEAGATFAFRKPREGWIFFRSTADVEEEGRLSLLLLGSDDPLTLHTGQGRSSLEAMRFLPAGQYSLSTESRKAELQSLVVRSVPELVFCGLQHKPYLPRIAAFGPYDWEFLGEAGVLANANVMVFRGGHGMDDPDHIPYMEQWTSQGKRWLSSTGLQNCPTPRAYARYFLSLPGFSHPELSGDFLDEIGLWGGSEDYFRALTGGLHLLAQDERGKGKRLYPYCGGLFEQPPAHDFVRAIMDYDHRLGWEVYLAEQPSLSEAVAYLDTRLRHHMMGWRSAFPGVERHIIATLGYMSAPPETLDRYPSVDYKVFMDMQLSILANDPVFSGLSGIMEYNSRNVDEEYLRWTAKLYRHYAIEGRRERLTSDPYKLSHISNGDFEQGARRWRLSPAQTGAITVGRKAGYGRISGRYPPVALLGDTFLCTRRSRKKANAFSQGIAGLTPGRAYSLKFISADREDLYLKDNHAVSVEIIGADVLPERTIHQLYEQVWCGTPHPWMNFHRIVFRARGETARLVISDWASPTEPGGSEGQQLIFNFVQVQPYLED